MLNILFCISNDINSALAKIRNIKAIVEKRETSCVALQRQIKNLNKETSKLKAENEMLRTYVDAKSLELDALKSDEETVDKLLNENQLLRKLTIKLHRTLK